MKALDSLFTGAAFALISLGAAAQDPATEDSETYRVKAGDTLEISVWQEPDLQGEVLVAPDYSFSFPLVGHVDVRGMGVEEIEQIVAERLARYISEPTVTVSIGQINGNTIYVIGEVNQRGAFVMNRELDVMQALSMAGGFTAFARPDDILILRRGESGQGVLAFRYSDVARGRNLEQNILLQSGDTIVVP